MKPAAIRTRLAGAALGTLVLLSVLTPAGEAVAQGMMNPLLVKVVNGIANAVLVRDVENPSREGIMLEFTCNDPGGADCATSGYQVPVGKRLVVEQAFAHVVVPAGQSVLVSLRHPTILDSHYLDIQRQGTFGALDVFTAARAARMYVNGGDTILAHASRTSFQGNLFLEVRLAGYLLDCGPGGGCPIP